MKKRFGKWTFAALCALMLFLAGIPTAAAQSEMPQVILTFDKESVNVGEEVTASYEVVGGSGEYRDFYLNINAVTHGLPGQSDLTHTVKEVRLSERTGLLTAVPMFGYELYAYLIFQDENGQTFYFDTGRIPVLGDTTVFPTVTVTLDKSSVEVGEDITASYEVVGGSGEYRNFNLSIDVVTHGLPGESDLTNTVKEVRLSERTGSLTAVPMYGYELYAYLIFQDENGQTFYFDTGRIAVLGDTTVFPTVTLTLDKSSVEIGEDVTVSYEVVEGSGKYSNFYLSIEAVAHGLPGYSDLAHTLKKKILTGRTGSLTAVPKFGYELYAYLVFKDENGQSFYFNSGEIPITGTTGTFTAYKVTEGGNNPVYPGSGELTFRVDAEFAKFRTVLVDDERVSETAYLVWPGSTYVALKESYLKALPFGPHTISVLFTDGYAETLFTVERATSPQPGDGGTPTEPGDGDTPPQTAPASTPPQTGDSATPFLWLALCLLAGAGLLRGLRLARRHS